MGYKKNDKKINFFKIAESEQRDIVKNALLKSKQQQKSLEKKYEKLLMQKISC